MLVRILILIIFSSLLGLICGLISQIDRILKKEQKELTFIKKIHIVVNLIFSKKIKEIFKPYSSNQINKIIRVYVLEELKIKNNRGYSLYLLLENKNFKIIIESLAIVKDNLSYTNYFSEKIQTNKNDKNYSTIKKFSFNSFEVKI